MLDVDYVLEEDVEVRLFCVDEDGEPLVALQNSFRPYFYALPSGDPEEAREEILSTEFELDGKDANVLEVEETDVIDGREEVKALKVVLKEPPSVPRVREAVSELEGVGETREFDIPFYKRYLIDTGVEPMNWYRFSGETIKGEGLTKVRLEQPPEKTTDPGYQPSRLAFDLEVHEDEIIMCSFYSDGFEKLLVQGREGFGMDAVETVEGEKKLVERVIEVVKERDPDILLGYNTDEFDFDVLRERAEEHGIELEMGRTG